MPSTSVTELQGKLFKRLGIDAPGGAQKAPVNSGGKGHRPLTRKDKRKAKRTQKKSQAYSRNDLPPKQSRSVKSHAPHSATNGSRQPKSILKKSKSPRPVVSNSDSEEISGDDFDEGSLGDSEDSSDDFDGHGSEDEATDDVDIALNTESKAQPTSGSNGKISRSAQQKLAQDDAEIEELQRKLGIKKGRRSLPKSFKDDGLDLLLGDLDADEEESDDEGKKRKRDYDDWLSAKRRKTGATAARNQSTDETYEDAEMRLDEDDENLFLDGDGLDGGEHGDEDDDLNGIEEESFEGFDSDVEEQPPVQPKQRENPYVAPMTGNVVAKYVPPSLRQSTGGEGEALTRLRKQVQGLINRLTDANILSIVQSVEDLYQRSARGDVTEALTDAILAQVCKPESLPDQFFVLTGGFSAAIYKLIGSSFGSHLVRRLVRYFEQEYDKASSSQHEESAIPKEPSNLITFLSQLYVFEVVGCKIIFDYMGKLLGDLTEINVELLLRICRNGGRLLRRDDPQALKHVSGALSKAVSKEGYANVSARTKFMVDTINDLKNKKAKGKGMDSAVVSEHVIRMKKRLGELKSQSRRLDGLAPMGMDLEDVVQADARGKWWLVGASVPVKPDKVSREKSSDVKGSGTDRDAGTDEEDMASDTDNEDMDFVLPDYPKKARAQGLVTPAQIATFTALMTALECEAGYRQFLNLKLKKDDQLEIARVLVQCVGSEPEYNPYYAAVGERACTNGRIRFAFQTRLWQIFRAMGESLFGEEIDNTETADGVRFQDEQRVQKVAHFYAALLVDGALRISVLKPLNLADISPSTSLFLEWLVISLLQECRSKKADKEDAKVEKVFGVARDTPKLAAGIDWLIREKLRKTKLISSKEMKKLEMVKRKAQRVVLEKHLVEES